MKLDYNYFKSLYDTYYTTQDFENELWPLIRDVLIPLNPKNVLEIGVSKGGSAVCWLSFTTNNNGFVVGVDGDIKQSYDTFYKFQDSLPEEERDFCDMAWVEGDTTQEETLKNVSFFFTGKTKLDFLYIDASHDEDSVYKDIKNYYPLLRQGGIIAFHDYGSGNNYPTGVRRAIERHKEEGLVKFSDEGLFKGHMGTYWGKKV